MDRSLWTGYVEIHQNGDPRKADFVVRHCLHSGTRSLTLRGTVDELPSYEENLALLTANPSLTLMRLQWITSEEGGILALFRELRFEEEARWHN